MFKVDDSEVQQFESDLDKFAHRALPFATRATLNGMAFKAQELARENIRNKMTTRNVFTKRSVLVDRAQGLDMKRMESVVGSTEEYMETQEFGGQTDKKGKNKTGIPTSYAAGQRGARPRTRLPRSQNAMKNIKLRKLLKNIKGTNARQEAFITALVAVNSGNKFVYFKGRTGGSSGVYRVFGRERKNGRYRGVRMRMVYNTRKQSLRIPKTPWLAPAVEDIPKELPKIYRESLLFQLRKHHILGH